MNPENPRVLSKNSRFANKSYISKQSRKPSVLAVEGFGDLPNLPFSEEWVKRISIPKIEGYQKWNWFKRIHPKVRVLKWKTGLTFLNSYNSKT